MENRNENVTKLKKKFVLKGGRNELKKYNADLKFCQDVQHFRFDRGLEWLKYSVLVAGQKPSKMNGVNKIYMDDLAGDGGGEDSEFP